MRRCYFIVLLIIILGSISSIRSSSIGICATARREGSLLIEWIEYHALIGVKNFYIYLAPEDTISPEEHRLTQALLKPYESPNNRSFQVKLFNYRKNAPHTNPQALSYETCMARFSRFNTWLLFIDVDEFVVFPSGFNLAPVLRRHIPRNTPKFGGFCLTWLNLAPSPPYDRSEVARPVDSLLTEIPHFFVDWDIGKRGKIAIYTRASSELTRHCYFARDIHYAHECFQPYDIVEVFSTQGEKLKTKATCDVPEWPTTLGLYHYFFRTCHEWVNELVPKRTEFNTGLGYQLEVDNIRYSPGGCSSSHKFLLNVTGITTFDRFIPLLRERVRKHPLWGTPINFFKSNMTV